MKKFAVPELKVMSIKVKDILAASTEHLELGDPTGPDTPTPEYPGGPIYAD